ncbi:GNAT family N-acetyltransferase [Mangrovibacillus cuniculi]|uniref:GNAT family N-acetyltransferase n=1 Tax=Mangrovibacillus cuniculi TaxID=2593652 RepID=A0A7S8CDT3_9BACI|nr:GNAT family protein [Mangrovibacillus cuniculi]QPC48129.1 GNAT family N-acetyltransferase [Mangrovibacillus cuniculi]
MNPILREIPKEISSDRLLLRCPKVEDTEQLYTAIERSLDDLKLWLPFAYKGQNKEETEINLRQAIAKFDLREALRFIIVEKATDQVVGSTGFHNLDWSKMSAEIGYWLDSTYTGKGYVTEAVNALTKFAFETLELKRVEIRCEGHNWKSRAVAERSGYILEGVLRKEDWSVDEQKLTDTCIYALLDEDYFSKE